MNNESGIKDKVIYSSITSRSSFTLIELLVVIAILSILAVTVILTLNPSELLKQARDSTRLSDIAQINNALNLYQVDSPNGSFGNASTTYISIPDPSATSTTQGNQCSGLGLPSLPAGYSYHCSASSTYRNSDGTGWLPVNFQAMSYGSPLGVLPIDPINNGSSTYYTYTPGGSWQLTATPESNKIRTTQANQSTGAITAGSDLTLSPLFNPNGLVGYWKFDEGSGTTAKDSAGTNTGTLTNGPGWVDGKVGGGLNFSAASSQNVTVANSSSLNLGSGNFTISLWYKNSSDYTSNDGILLKGVGGVFNSNGTGMEMRFRNNPNVEFCVNGGVGTCPRVGSGTTSRTSWNYLVIVVSRTNTTSIFYLNGVATNSMAYAPTYTDSYTLMIGQGTDSYFRGIIDDVRIYSRALSYAEIMALYSATR